MTQTPMAIPVVDLFQNPDGTEYMLTWGIGSGANARQGMIRATDLFFN